MADVNDKKNEENSKDQKGKEQSSRAGILTWIIMAVVVVVCAGVGFGVSRLLAGLTTAKKTEPSQEDKPTPPPDSAGAKSWYYDLEPVATNLNVPGATRYVRATLTLEISPEVKEDEGKKLLEQKKPVLTNLLTIYFKGLTLEDLSTDKDMRRIQYQILDALNEELFPDAKPQVRKILFKEFAIQ